MTAVALRAILLTHPPSPSLCPRLRCAPLRGLGHPRRWMGTESGRHEPLRAPLPLRGAFRAPLPLRGVGTFLRSGGRHIPPLRGVGTFLRSAPKRASPLSAPKRAYPSPLRKEPTPTPLQRSPPTPSTLQRSPTHLMRFFYPP